MTAQLQPDATRGEALKALRAMLAEAGIDSSAADARLLLCAAANLNSADLIREPDCVIGEATLARLAPMAGRRAAR